MPGGTSGARSSPASAAAPVQVKAQDTPAMIASMASKPEGRRAAWAFLQSEWPKVEVRARPLASLSARSAG